MRVDVWRPNGTVDIIMESAHEDDAITTTQPLAVVLVTARITNRIGVPGVACVDRRGRRLSFTVDPERRKRTPARTGAYVRALLRRAFKEELAEEVSSP
jgi:hypothetical protein